MQNCISLQSNRLDFYYYFRVSFVLYEMALYSGADGDDDDNDDTGGVT